MKKYILQLIIVLVFILLKVEGVYSSSPMNYYNITTFEGLPSNTVNAIKKDASGFIWIGTKVGLCRFDGCEVKTYPLLSEDDIWSIEELDSDTLLLGTVSGLKYFSRKTNVTVKLDIPSAIVKSIRKIADSQFFVGTEAGLYFINNHTPRQIFLETGLSPCNHITSIICEDKNIYWFSTADGLGRIDIRTMQPEIYRMPEEISNSNFFICLTRMGNHIYLGSFNKGIFSFDMSGKKFAKVNGFEHNLIMTIDGQDNQLFVGTNGQGLKVLSLEVSKLFHIRRRHGILSVPIQSLHFYMIMAFVGLEPSLGESVIHLVLVPSSLITVKMIFTQLIIGFVVFICFLMETS